MSSETVACHECGGGYQRLGQHWSMGNTCSHPPLTDKQRDIVVGLLMGDGNLHRRSKNSYLQCNMITEGYLHHLDEVFGMISCGVTFVKSAEDSAKENRNSGFSPNAKEENYHDVYQWRSRNLPDLNGYNSWYETGEKVWPDDIDLTPTVLKHWYCGDGHYADKAKSDCITIALSNEAHNEEKVNNYFTRKGLPEPTWAYSKRSRDGSEKCSIKFARPGSQELFDYMGDPLPGFHYKWGIEEPDGPTASDTGTTEEVVA